MPRPPQPQPIPAITQGIQERVPCPHCGKHNDLRDVDHDSMLERGNTFECDHCGGAFDVVKVYPTKLVTVQRSAGGRTQQMGGGGGRVAQARTISPAAAQRLLRGR